MRFHPKPRPAAQPAWTPEELAILRGEPVPPRDMKAAAWQLATRYPSLTMDQCSAAVRLAAEVLEQQHTGRP